LAERAIKLRSFGYGMDAYSNPETVGMNYRMTEMQAALGTAQLGRMPELMAARIENLKALNAHLGDLPRMGSSYGMNVILPADVNRDQVRERLSQRPNSTTPRDAWRPEENGKQIETAVHYPRPIPDIAYYRNKYGTQEFPVARLISARSLTLPVGPHLWPEQMKIMATRLHEAIDESRHSGGGRVRGASPGPALEAAGPPAIRVRQSQRQPHCAVA